MQCVTVLARPIGCENGESNGAGITGPRLRATALFVIVVGIIGIVAASMLASEPMRHWYLVHETPAYVVLPALMFALAVRPRARRNEPSTT